MRDGSAGRTRRESGGRWREKADRVRGATSGRAGGGHGWMVVVQGERESLNGTRESEPRWRGIVMPVTTARRCL